MQFELVHDYPAALDRLWMTFGQAGYLRRKYAALGAIALRLLRFEADAARINVELERDMSTDAARLPPWARTFVGRSQTLHQRSTWRRLSPSQAIASLDIVPEGLPVHAHGAATIDEVNPRYTCMRVTWRVESAAPVIGARVARLFGDEMRRGLVADHAFTLRYLAEVGATRAG